MTTTGALERRPKRADARRNYDKLIEAARGEFTENGPDASLENIARRAGVGIGTLYRHFPSRQDLLEATYLEEVEALCDSADDFADLPAVGQPDRLARSVHAVRRDQEGSLGRAARDDRHGVRDLQDVSHRDLCRG